jgi:hypothetical protein
MYAPIVFYLNVSGKSKSIKHNIIELAQHSLQGFLLTISGSASSRLKNMDLNEVSTYFFVKQLFFN